MDTKKNPAEEAENIEKYFDEENYSTLVVAGGDAQKEKKKHIEDFVDLLTNGVNEDKVTALKLLKDANAQELLIEAILNTDNKKVNSLLVAACWESALDFGKYADSFFKLAVDDDLLVSLEAVTVLENIEVFESKETLKEGIDVLAKAIKNKHPNFVLLEDLKIHLFEKLKNFDHPKES